MRRYIPVLCALVALVACGGSAPAPRGLSARQALAQNSELVEFDTLSTRGELFREISRSSLAEAGKAADQPVFFPIVRRGELVAAPGIELRDDLFQALESPSALELVFEVRGSERWPNDAREGLQGLSEREAAELVARWLLTHWKIETTGQVLVDRASGAPYAAAYVDGILRVNPAFLYMASSSGMPSTVASQ